MTLDEIYGCTLEEYLKYHNKTRDDLIGEIEKDIELLNKSKMHFAENKDKYTLEELVETTQITKLVEKKREHLKRVKTWS